MEQPHNSKTPSGTLLVFILTVGVFGIINTEMGVVGILPLIADTFQVSIPRAGWTISLFALVVALSAPVTPLLFSRVNRKAMMLLTLGLFMLSNLVSMLTSDFTVLLVARVLPAFLHPVYVSMAFTIAASSVGKEKAPKAVAKVFVGVSAGMVLGVPVTSYIASELSFSTAMFFFAAVNTGVFIATWLFVPSMPVTEKLSYGAQLRVLRRPVIWYSIATVILVNGAMFGFFSYLSDYLKKVTEVPYTGLFLAGEWRTATTLLILLLGILAGIAGNGMQYMLNQAAPEAPDFTNGMFLASANLGTTVGTAVCGAFITGLGTRYTVMGTLIFLAASMIFICLRFRTLSFNLKLRTQFINK